VYSISTTSDKKLNSKLVGVCRNYGWFQLAKVWHSHQQNSAMVAC